MKGLISSDIHLIFIVSLILCYLFSWIILGFLVLISYLFLLYLFRVNSSMADHLHHDKEVYSPVNGVVVSVNDNVDHLYFGKGLKEVRILTPLLAEMTIRLPIKSDHDDGKYIGNEDFFRFQKDRRIKQEDEIFSGELVTLKTPSKLHVGLQFIRCTFGLSAKIWTRPGDRGKRGGIIGLFPLGGTTLVYLPADMNLAVKKDDKVKAATTLLAN